MNRRLIIRAGLGIAILLSVVAAARLISAQSGVLIPSTGTKPDAKTLSLNVMNVDVLIDNQHARVKVSQIFDNHTSQVLEGKYLFALPPAASIYDFAVWDGDVRIPGVMMEKRRANKIYSEIKQQPVDPGLLQQDDEHEGNSAFSAKVVPIPAYGTKRIEMEYTEMLSVDGLVSHFTFPLKPSFGDPQPIDEFNLHLHVISEHPITPIAQSSYALTVVKSEPNEFEAEFRARGIELKEDFAFDYRLNVPDSTLSFTTYRAPEKISSYDLRDPKLATNNPAGYFEARAVFNQQAKDQAREPRNVVLLLDTSLSMYGEKLKRAVEAVDYFLHSLSPQDRFDLVLFNDEPYAFSPVPLPATPENVEQSMAFIKNSMLGGATDLRKALVKAVEVSSHFPAGEHSIVLISDANPTVGTRSLKKVIETVAPSKVGSSPLRVFAFGLGSDANGTLLEQLAKSGHGYFARARETEDIGTALKIFFDHVGSTSIERLRFASDDTSNFFQVYASSDYSFDGSSLAYVGRYRTPSPRTTITLQAEFGTQPIKLSRDVVLPELSDEHRHLPRVWARARVDALLREMDLNGEREDYISEIIQLSEKYRFVTPYTAFIAAPRALLRPRLIQPGDPVLRVKTDKSINSVFAVFPFGETLPLTFLQSEGVWEVRFFAPSWLPDGTYRCRLLMTDKDGNAYQEAKSFVIDSHAPRLKVKLANTTVRAGEDLVVKVSADSDTVRLFARMYGSQPAQLTWLPSEQTNVGKLRIGAGLATGRYTITVSAEDSAHNQSTTEIPIDVIGR